jgi:hypothetical protein
MPDMEAVPPGNRLLFGQIKGRRAPASGARRPCPLLGVSHARCAGLRKAEGTDEPIH